MDRKVRCHNQWELFLGVKVHEPHHWRWNSFRHYACNERGPVLVKQTRRAVLRIREISLCHLRRNQPVKRPRVGIPCRASRAGPGPAPQATLLELWITRFVNSSLNLDAYPRHANPAHSCRPHSGRKGPAVRAFEHSDNRSFEGTHEQVRDAFFG